MGAEDDYQVAAPTESRTPHWHRAKLAHTRVRMEGWRQRRLGCGKNRRTKERALFTLDLDRSSHGRPLAGRPKNKKLANIYDDESDVVLLGQRCGLPGVYVREHLLQ